MYGTVNKYMSVYNSYSMKAWEYVPGVYHQSISPLIRVARVTLSIHSWFSSVSVSNTMSIFIPTEPGYEDFFSLSLMPSWPLSRTPWFPSCLSSSDLLFWLGTLVIFMPWSLFFLKYLLNMTLCPRNTDWRTQMFDSQLSLTDQVLLWFPSYVPSILNSSVPHGPLPWPWS